MSFNGFEVEFIHLLTEKARFTIGLTMGKTRKYLVKPCIVLGHDFFLQFGACFDGGRERLVEVGETLFDLGSHRDSDLHVLALGLEDGDALVDDGTPFVQGTLFACGVLGKHRIGSAEELCLAVDGAEGDVSDRAGEGLNRLIRVECYFCHCSNFFLPCCFGGL